MQVGYPLEDKELVPFFQKEYEDFDEATLKFSRFLWLLFREVARRIRTDGNLTKPKAWCDWLDNGTNRYDMYHTVLWEDDMKVRGYSYILVAKRH